jgi:hypothetical protein
MTSLATVEEFRRYMDSIGAQTDDADTLIQDTLDRASAIVLTEVTHGYSAATGTATVYGTGSDQLVLPVFVAGTVTSVTAPTGYSVPTYVEQNGRLVVASSNGVVYGYGHRGYRGWSSNGYGGWIAGVPYTVHAMFGWGATVPDDIKEATLEIAIAIYRGREAGFSDVVGVAGTGEVAYTGKYPKRADAILKRYRQAANPLRIT